jgi:hypothetical protein
LVGGGTNVWGFPGRKPHMAKTKSSAFVVAAVVPLTQALVVEAVLEVFWSTPLSGVVSTA